MAPRTQDDNEPGSKQVPGSDEPVPPPPSTWLPPETARGIRNFIEDRATEHRAREEASAGTDASTEAAIRAEECVDIVTDLERYWGAG